MKPHTDLSLSRFRFLRLWAEHAVCNLPLHDICEDLVAVLSHCFGCSAPLNEIKDKDGLCKQCAERRAWEQN